MCKYLANAKTIALKLYLIQSPNCLQTGAEMDKRNIIVL